MLNFMENLYAYIICQLTYINCCHALTSGPQAIKKPSSLYLAGIQPVRRKRERVMVRTKDHESIRVNKAQKMKEPEILL